ncbi:MULTISPECIES: hypothetical protein [Shouchella]|uniref:Uncharacterized protein n=1 Tax=Shouchella lehensis G1 TaxID=1246626 RepID=A0A060LS57_9BACI|nr:MULTISPECIES: hypothetical protein [Bacillaceae]AIC92987.1 hypothetical protein BleG1_0379 [Shouchella lehensis G1]
MYKVERTVNGVTVTFKDSNSHLDKTFNDPVAAKLLAKKLNLDLIIADNDEWRVVSCG